MTWVWDSAEKLGAFAELLLSITALVALLFAYLQIRTAQQSQREATTKEIYRDYLKLAVEYPELASPDERGQKILQDYKYRWFVAVMLNACEEIIEVFQNDEIWREVVLSEMECHEDYLHSKFFLAEDEDHGWKLYSKELKMLFKTRFPSA